MSDAGRLDELLAAFTPEVEARARAALDLLRARLPGAVELVFDGYHQLVVGFGPTEHVGAAVFSVAVYARGVNVFLLRGGGTRNVPVTDAAALEAPAVRDLIDAAVAASGWRSDEARAGRVVVRSVAEKKRPRRPPGA